MQGFYTPWPLRVDAYQLAHFMMIPPGMEDFEASHGIFRKELSEAQYKGKDLRLVAAGSIPFALLELLDKPLSMQDVDDTEAFLSDFHAMVTEPYVKAYPFPRSLFERVVKEHGGRVPVCVMALPDGQAHYVGEPVVQAWTDVPGMGELVGWIESSLLPYMWAMSIVATRGRVRKQRMLEVYRQAYPRKSDQELLAMLEYKFHDFGRRGAANSQMTGIAHLMNWLGTDTMDAAYAATRYLNAGEKFGACSIAAAAHRTVTPWSTESQAFAKMVEEFGDGLFSIVPDSYEYYEGLQRLTKYAQIVKDRGGCMIGRPDSGDPVECVVAGLQHFKDAFGYTKQESGLMVLKNSAIIQGDGIDDQMIFERIYPAVIAAGFCPSNVAFGMGEKNHRAVRSETELAYKTSMVAHLNGAELSYHSVMKGSNSQFKMSIPGLVSMHHQAGCYQRRVRPITLPQLKRGDVGDYLVVYDGRPDPLPVTHESFAKTRQRCWETWNELPAHPGDSFEQSIRQEQKRYIESMATKSV